MQWSAFSPVDYVNAEIENFLSLCGNATFHCRIGTLCEWAFRYGQEKRFIILVAGGRLAGWNANPKMVRASFTRTRLSGFIRTVQAREASSDSENDPRLSSWGPTPKLRSSLWTATTPTTTGSLTAPRSSRKCWRWSVPIIFWDLEKDFCRRIWGIGSPCWRTPPRRMAASRSGRKISSDSAKLDRLTRKETYHTTTKHDSLRNGATLGTNPKKA